MSTSVKPMMTLEHAQKLYLFKSSKRNLLATARQPLVKV